MYLPKQVELTQFWAQELMNIPYISRKYFLAQEVYFVHIQFLIVLLFFGEEFGGRNPGTIKALPKRHVGGEVGRDGHDVMRQPAAPIRYTISVSLKQWLA